MNNRNARRLLLVVALVFVTSPAALAQRQPTIRFGWPQNLPDSHRPLDEGSPDALEASLSDRLRQLREARELQQLAQRLVNNPDFLKDFQNIPSEKLEDLRAKLTRGEGLGGDETFRKILDEASKRKHVSGEEAEKLKRWADSQKPPEMSHPPTPGDISQPHPGSTPPGVIPQAPAPPPPKPASPWAKVKDEGTSWLKERMTDLPEGVANLLDNVGEGALGESVRDALLSLGRGGMDGESLPFDLQQAFRDVAEKMSTLGEYVPSDPVPWQEVRSLFQDLHGPSLPSFEGPAVSPGTVSPGGDGFGMAWLWLAVLVVFAFILYRSMERRRASSGAAGWRLGPWPVAPGAVATRGDLVVAFEYLAFLCLGPSARTCNHLDVADRLGEQSADAARRRAAGELAHLYEQARYAPDDEPLSATDLAAARRDLCLLAGVATA
jgi:hypothetical protein